MKQTAFGKEIERLRIERGMTQIALALAVGVSKVTICTTEKGRAVLADHYIRRAAEALSVSALPLLELAAFDRGVLTIREKPPVIQRLICRLAHGDDLSQEAAAKLTAILDHEPVAA